jgi:hypothetical protein
MAEIIAFPAAAKRAPEPHPDVKPHVHIDHKGTLWYRFMIEFQIDDAEFSFDMWARDMDDANRRLQIIKNNAKLVGQVVSTI